MAALRTTLRILNVATATATATNGPRHVVWPSLSSPLRLLTSAGRGDEHVHLSSRLPPDLRPRRAEVCTIVGEVVELIGVVSPSFLGYAGGKLRMYIPITVSDRFDISYTVR